MIAEFALAMSFIALFIVVSIRMPLLNLKNLMSDYSALRAQRVAAVYDSDEMSAETAKTRIFPQQHALPAGLSDEELRGGDTPSPYCVNGENYEACGYPE